MAEIRVENIDKDCYKHILKVQGEKKVQKGISQYSLPRTVLDIIKEHKELTEKKR